MKMPFGENSVWYSLNTVRGRSASCAGRDIRPGHDQRDAGRGLVHRALPPQAVLAELLAMVGGVDDTRVPGLAGRLEGFQHQTDLLVQEGNHAVISLPRPTDGRFVEWL